jgi:hypothetical protein
MIRHIWPVLILCSLFPVSNGLAQNGKGAVTQATESAVTEAIADEIYDWGCQKYTEFVGEDFSRDDERRLRVYINPKIDNGRGEVIYKFMPIGEIYRSFFMLRNGSVYLGDDPWLGFGPERPSYQTVYMDDDELCRFKHDWLKTTVTIEFNPSAARVRLANQRQRYRWGKAYRVQDRKCSVNGE